MGRSLADDAISDATRIVGNTDDFAKELRYTPPNGGLARVITGLWYIGKSRVDMSNGVEVIHPATLMCSGDEVVERKGILTIGGLAWPVTEVSPPDNGVREVSCERRTPNRTSAMGSNYGK